MVSLHELQGFRVYGLECGKLRMSGSTENLCSLKSIPKAPRTQIVGL